MSKNIIIQEGGTAKQLTVDKLKTNVVGGGTCLWVPEDEATLGTLNATENGTYKAKENGYYGYSEVTVSVPGGAGGPPGGVGSSLVGKDKDGNDALITVDQNGNISEETLPNSIAIDVMPLKLTYEDGETIDVTGLVVKAYKRDGTLWTDNTHSDGVISIPELIFPDTIADISEGWQDYTDSGTHKVLSVGSILQTIDYALTLFNGTVNSNGIIEQVKNTFEQYDGINPGYVRVSPDAPSSYGGWSPFDVQIFATVKDGDTITLGNSYSGQHDRTAARGNGGLLTFYNYSIEVSNGTAFVGRSQPIPGYGIYISSLVVEGIPGGQAIPVNWNRPGDGLLLQTSFNIAVTPATENE